jgi:CHAD domain-containing protein
MPATLAVAIILRTLFAAMQENEAGIIQDENNECLHDFRVAVRRTRSALSQLQEALPANEVKPFQDGFNWLGSLTGPLRDLDVYLLGFNDDQAMLPCEMRDHLLPLKAFLSHSRTLELQKLKRGIDSDRYRTLMGNWQALIDGQLSVPPMPEAHATPILALANRRIDKMYARVLRQGQEIDRESSDEQLHRLRKSCKKLCYLLEFFVRIYPEKAVSRQIRALKKLQDALGVAHDLAVQCVWLHNARLAMRISCPPSEATLQAMDLLHASLHKRQQKARKKFIACFSKFDDKQHRRALQHMLGTTETE